MSSNSKPPPYSEATTSKESKDAETLHPPISQISTKSLAPTGVAEGVQTCSIKDQQYDYLQILRDSTASYHVCLTVDHTPRYRINLVSDATGIAYVEIYPFFTDNSSPVAVARISRRPKEPLAMTCVSEPSRADAEWQPLNCRKWYQNGPTGIFPIVIVPGLAPKLQSFNWAVHYRPNPSLWWKGELHLPVKIPPYHDDDRDSTYMFASILRGKKEGDPNVIEIRRGGGIKFELTIILHAFVILDNEGKEFL